MTTEELKKRFCDSIDAVQKCIVNKNLKLEYKHIDKFFWIGYNSPPYINLVYEYPSYDWRVKPRTPLTGEQAGALKFKTIICPEDIDCSNYRIPSGRYVVVECYAKEIVLLRIPTEDKFKSVTPIQISNELIVDWEQPDGIKLYR